MIYPYCPHVLDFTFMRDSENDIKDHTSTIPLKSYNWGGFDTPPREDALLVCRQPTIWPHFQSDESFTIPADSLMHDKKFLDLALYAGAILDS
jgi:hypothetical protein